MIQDPDIITEPENVTGPEKYPDYKL